MKKDKAGRQTDRVKRKMKKYENVAQSKKETKTRRNTEKVHK